MRFSEQIRSISYLKTHAAEVLTALSESGAPLIITQNGEAKAVLQDVVAYEQTQESLALLKVLALGQQQVEAGAVTPVESVVQRLKNKRG
jgi:prevent-host-death family protein